MSNVLQHYDDHLANYYSWMTGDFETHQKQQEAFFREKGIMPFSAQHLAIDLGAGHGLQSISLAKLGFSVKSVDLVKLLLFQLQNKIHKLDIEILVDDLRNVLRFKPAEPELIMCYGDTIAHLHHMGEIKQLIVHSYETLIEGGKLVLSFRDYSVALTGDDRFIPVRSDHHRILTCFLEYFADKVKVTDIVHERSEEGWQQKISTYEKVRLYPDQIVETLKEAGFRLELNEKINGQIVIIAQK